MSAEAEGPAFQVIEGEKRTDCIVNTLGDLDLAVKELRARGVEEDAQIFFYLGVQHVIAPVVWARTKETEEGESSEEGLT